MKPICATCRLFFKPKKNGVFFEEGMPLGAPAAPSLRREWGPYKLWAGDLWACRGCGAEIVVGTGHNPIAVHHQPEYARLVAAMPPAFRVDDC